MPTDRSSAGDPARTLELLWRQGGDGPAQRGDGPKQRGEGPRQRGPRQTLTVDQIVRTATAVADADGLDAVTMRRVAQDLRVAPMSLYTYVPGKNELLDLMLDAAYLGMARSAPAGESGQVAANDWRAGVAAAGWRARVTAAGWRARVTAVAQDNRELFARHRWIAGISVTRPPLGPGVMAKYEYELAAFEGLGLGDVQMDAALTFVLGFVETCARAEAGARAAESESAMTDGQWWAANAPLLSRVLDPEAYPLASRVGSAAGAAYGGASDPDYAYRFGLERVLDGLAALIDQP